ncbi:probable F420-dependent oxidoreductase, MSMEG_4141 family [Trujillonella endophytica]|uniref:Probable F420-dependent oxidoreductase, MSMEG_4141 family n=1 Tax=Trujillonella endophytica TaxID=673521 RepID=A0A1H8QSX9_9ACTN|nr:probable F420-dependent oxidoreductase, MSMEG_4141 family [Trujillella endophytica]
MRSWGIWRVERDWTPESAAELEALGFDTLWIGGSRDNALRTAELLLAATRYLTVATGILNVWSTDADAVARSFHRLDERFPGRFLLGVGSGHREAFQDTYTRPYTAVSRYLDRLDAHDVPPERRILAALGDRMVGLAAARSRGAHPYLVTPAHTAHARELLGPAVYLAPEQKVVLDRDPVTARSIGRPVVAEPYLRLANYRNSLRTLGYTDAQMDHGGSDSLIDDLVVHGEPDTVRARLEAHVEHGADHVAVQLLMHPGRDPLEEFRELAAVLDLRPDSGPPDRVQG